MENDELDLPQIDWSQLDVSFDSNTEGGGLGDGQDEQGELDDIFGSFEEFYDSGKQYSSPHDEENILEDLGDMKIEAADIDEVGLCFTVHQVASKFNSLICFFSW